MGALIGKYQAILESRTQHIENAPYEDDTVVEDSVELDSASAMKSVDANIKRGQRAITKALLEKTTVHRAMYRNDIGWIDFVWGKIGIIKVGSNKTKNGAGIEHIVESRMRKDNMTYSEVIRFLVHDLVEAIAKAPSKKEDIKLMDNSLALILTYRKTFVKLVKKNGSNGWVITSFEIYDEDGAKDGYHPLSPTQDFVTLTHKELGASLNTIIPQNKTKINMDGVETMNILQQIKTEASALAKTKLLKEWKSLGALQKVKALKEFTALEAEPKTDKLQSLKQDVKDALRSNDIDFLNDEYERLSDKYIGSDDPMDRNESVFEKELDKIMKKVIELETEPKEETDELVNNVEDALETIKAVLENKNSTYDDYKQLEEAINIVAENENSVDDNMLYREVINLLEELAEDGTVSDSIYGGNLFDDVQEDSVNMEKTREFTTYQAWKRAIKELDKHAVFTGDKEIDSAFKKRAYDADWDGEVGHIVVWDAVSR